VITYQCAAGILSASTDDGVACRLQAPQDLQFIPPDLAKKFPGPNLLTSYVVLHHHLGDRCYAALWCRDFMREVLHRLGPDGWTITEAQIRSWLTLKRQAIDIQ
jgi:hypothetical protein